MKVRYASVVLPLLLLLLVLECASAKAAASTNSHRYGRNKEVRTWLERPDTYQAGEGEGGAKATRRSVWCDVGAMHEWERSELDDEIARVRRGDDERGYGVITSHEGCGEGLAVAVAITKHPLKQYFTGLSNDIEPSEAVRIIHDGWGVGSDACGGNGVLLLIALHERAIEFSTGATARDILPDAFLERVIESMKPLLRGGQLKEAVAVAVRAMGVFAAGDRDEAARALTEYGEASSSSSTFGSFPWPFVLWAVIAIGSSALNIWRNTRKKREWDRCVSLLREIEERSEREGSPQAPEGRFSSTFCPICMTDFRKADGCAGSHSNKKDDDDDSAQEEQEQEQGLTRVSLECGHDFCSGCLREWLKRKTTCPMCREECVIKGDPTSGGQDPEQRETGSVETVSANEWSFGRMREWFASVFFGGSGSSRRASRSSGWMDMVVEDYDQDLTMHSHSGSASSMSTRALMRAFQLRRLGRLYPNYVDTRMINGLSPTARLSREAAFLERCPQTQVTRSMGNVGSSSASFSSFGGGHSGGGGGASGRW